MKDDLLSKATEWYFTKVAGGVSLSEDTGETWQLRQKMHISIWRRYLDKIGVAHVKNTFDFTIPFSGDDFVYRPAIVIPLLDISFVNYQHYCDHADVAKPERVIPLYISFDHISTTHDLDQISPGGEHSFAVADFPTLPCTNFKQQGGLRDIASQHCRFRSNFLTNEEYTEGKFANALFHQGILYFTGTSQAYDFSLVNLHSDIFGKLFLVGESELYVKQETANAKSRLDPCTDIANKIIVEFFQKYKDASWVQGEPVACTE